MLPGAEKMYKIKSFDDLFNTLNELKNELRNQRRNDKTRMKRGYSEIFLVIAKDSTLHKFPISEFRRQSGPLPARFTDKEERARYNRPPYKKFSPIVKPYHSVYLSNDAPKGTYPETSYDIDFYTSSNYVYGRANTYRKHDIYDGESDTTEFTRFSDGFVQVHSDLATTSNRGTPLRVLLEAPDIKVGAYIGILETAQ